MQESDHRHYCVLRARRERLRRRRAAKADEVAPPHAGHGGSLPECRRRRWLPALQPPGAGGL